MAVCNVHNIRFYNVTPRAINCTAYEPTYQKLALSRADSSIEIWDLNHTPHLERTIPGQKNGSVEAIVWCNKRLFTCGLHGQVSEQDLRNLKELYSVRVTAGSAWCLGINKVKTHIAVGTEDGYINIFTILEDGLRYEKLLDKQEGRILCLAWNNTGNTIVTGSIDAVRVWNVNTGHAVHKMTTGRSNAKKETIVWCIAVTDDFTIISGDSRGKLTFWDGNMGVSLESYQSHRADILCLALTDDQKTLFCAGVDPTIVSFQRINNGIRPSERQASKAGSCGQWTRSHQRKVCDHDVRALEVCRAKLFSGGVDSYLIASYLPKAVKLYPSILQSPCAQLCPQARKVLLRYPNHLEMWTLGATSNIYGDGEANGKDTSSVALNRDPVKLLELHSIRDEGIVCAAASSDGYWLCYSTTSLTRLYQVTEVESVPKLEKLSLPLEDEVAMNVTFSSDSSRAVMLTRQGRLIVVALTIKESPEVSILFEHRPYESGHLTDAVRILAISKCNSYVVAADHDSNIVVWKEKKYHCSLPVAKSKPTALAIHPVTNNIVVTYSDQTLVEFSLSTLSFTEFSRKLVLPESWTTSSFVATNVTFDPRNPDVIVFHSDALINVINRTETVDNPTPKIRRTQTPTQNFVFNTIKKYKHLVLFDWICDGEVAAVEVSPESLTNQLPPPLKVKKFGVM